MTSQILSHNYRQHRLLNLFIIITLCHLGLPIPIVVIAAGIANEHYVSENGLVY